VSADPRMTCPECGGLGHQPKEQVSVGHDEDHCDDRPMHDSTGGYGEPEYHWHYVDCIRCGREGTITPPEVLLGRLLAAMATPKRARKASAR
jgi:hypothetical protein